MVQFPVHRRERKGTPHLPRYADWAYSKALNDQGAAPDTPHYFDQ
jgi:hypothetical protein